MGLPKAMLVDANAPQPATVESGIPIPDRWSGGKGRASRYPWRSMEVGDSFAVPSDVKIEYFRRLVTQTQHTTGRKFTTHRTPDGYRCWRIG